MRIKRGILALIALGIILSVVGGIANFLFTPKGDKKKEIEQNLIKSMVTQDLKKNYSIHLVVQDKYDVDIVNNEGKFLVYYEGCRNYETGSLENHVWKKYKENELVSEEKCTWERLQKYLGFDIDEVHQDWKEQLKAVNFDKMKCNRIVSFQDPNDYTWRFSRDTKTDHFKLYVDSSKDGSSYEYLGIDYYRRYKAGEIDYQMCFSNDSPISYHLITNENFYAGNQCLSYDEIREKIDTMAPGELEPEEDIV